MKWKKLCQKKQVFRTKDLREFYENGKEGDHIPSNQAQSNLLQYHKKKGHLIHLKGKHGLYCYVPEGSDPKKLQVDPFLLCAALTDDSVISYHTALAFWGYLHSERNTFIYSTNRRLGHATYSFQGLEYKAVSFPKKLKVENCLNVGVVEADWKEGKVLVTSLERTFVDVLDRNYLLHNDWEEIYRSLGSIEYLNAYEIISYAECLGNKTTFAKVGYFLSEFKDQWQIESSCFDTLKELISKQKTYIDRKSEEKQQLIPEWNLFVPKSLANKEWEEPYENI